MLAGAIVGADKAWICDELSGQRVKMKADIANLKRATRLLSKCKDKVIMPLVHLNFRVNSCKSTADGLQ
jgi:hypothetical protein